MAESTIEDTYRGPRHQGEYDRLRIQHELAKTAMQGKLLYSPVDLTQPNLRVLDSATGEGTWLIDLAQSVPASASLFGTDIAPQHFMAQDQRPSNVHLSPHSIFEPWPAEYQDRSCETPFACAKPGGFIELHEGDMLSIQEGPDHVAFMKFRDIMVNAWKAIGHQPNPGSFLAQWLKGAGAIDIQQDRQTIKVGAAADDKEQGERALAVLLHLLDGMKKMLSDKPGQPTSSEFDDLRRELEHELRTVGNVYYYHLAWAKKATVG
ncbi:hypothetical protein TrVFT333_009351 [Trichoderma virens FT-333]|nr:hypothetical protein TrVFT333_009351 [Trichoderma virens FT-333]